MMSMNISTPSNLTHLESAGFPLEYRVLATVVHISIFICGVIGNILVIVLVHRTRSLQSPTYSYLVSLAVADLTVLCSAVPEAIIVHHLGNRWHLGQIGCSVFIFVNFLGINAGSLSILGFTLEQYAVLCMASKSNAGWFSGHTKQIVGGLWLFAILYCSPWLVLTEVRTDPAIFPRRQRCDLRQSRQLYLGLFGADLLLFYVIPLAVAIVCYAHISVVLMRTTSHRHWESPRRGSLRGAFPPAVEESTSNAVLSAVKRQLTTNTSASQRWRARQPQSHKQVVRMLVVVVLLFAVTWLPFRGLLIYNSFAERTWSNLWYMFFAKTLIYLNSALNPVLYNVMSPRFRMAASRMLCGKQGRQKRPVRVEHGSKAHFVLVGS